MKQLILTVTFVLAMSLGVHARDWSLNKDTVYEWNANGDSVLLINQGTDTLRIDTGIVEIFKPMAMDTVEILFGSKPTMPGPGGFAAYYRKNGGGKYSLQSTLIIPSSSSVVLIAFQVDWPILLPLGKLSATAAKGDTILCRLILIGDLNRGRDTVMVKGIWNNAKPAGLTVVKSTHSKLDGELFDPLGRSQNKQDFYGKFLSVPLLSPKK